jgi:hypothetical protein
LGKIPLYDDLGSDRVEPAIFFVPEVSHGQRFGLEAAAPPVIMVAKVV